MRKSYLVLVLVGVLATIVISLAAFNSFQKLIKTLKYAREVRSQREDLNALLSNIKDAETSQRGYVITGNDDYLEPYYMVLQIIDEQMRVLQKNLAYSYEQKSLLQDLFHLIKLKLNELSDNIETRRTQGFEAARKKMLTNEGKEYMDSIRGTMAQLINNQTQEIHTHTLIVEGLVQKSFLLNLWSGIISSFLITLFSFLFYRDTKELAKVKRQFKQTSDLYKAILDSAKQMIITTDTSGRVTSFNKGAEKSLGYRAEDVVDKFFILQFYDPENVRSKAEELARTKHIQYSDFDALVASSRYFIWFDSEWMMKKKNGEVFPSSQTITALRNESNSITGYLIIGSDVSDYKRWEQELKETQEAIEIAQLSKNQFLASLNHEIRAPLNTIMNFASLLIKNAGGNLKDLEIAYAARIRDSCQAMLNLINEIVDISKREEALANSNFTPIKLDIFVKEMIDEMRELKEVQFLVEIPNDVKPFETDIANFSGLIKHLIRHAAHHFKGQLVIRARTNSQNNEPIEVEIIQSETKQPVGEMSTSPQEETVDLAIARSLANRLGYQIKIVSRYGKGTTYSVVLNRNQEVENFPRINPENSSLNDPKNDLLTGNLNLTVLVIDDDADFRSLLTAYLQDLGCHVIAASTGSEVIQLAKSHPIDLITMDMLMSPLNGYEIVQQLQGDPKLKNIPYAFISIIAKDIQNKIPGALAFINKPITRDDLIHLLQMCQAQRKIL